MAAASRRLLLTASCGNIARVEIGTDAGWRCFKPTRHTIRQAVGRFILLAGRGLRGGESRSLAVRSIRFGHEAQAILPGAFADDETGGAPAFEIHGPAAVRPASVPGDVIKPAFAADDRFVWLHDNRFADDIGTVPVLTQGPGSEQVIFSLYHEWRRKDRFK